MTHELSKDCLLDIRLQSSGHGLQTLEIYQKFPLAQKPRWQRVMQVTGTADQIRSIANDLDALTS